MSQRDAQQMRDDLAFVSNAVRRRREFGRANLALNVLWGLIIMGGLAVVDFRHHWVYFYWTIAGTVGWVAVMTTALAAEHRRKEAPAWRAFRGLAHWVLFSGAMVLLFVIGYRRNYENWQIGQMALLLAGVAAVMTGLHIDSSWLAPGVVLLIGAYVSIRTTQNYLWTVVGLGVFLSLTVGSVVRVWHRDRRATTA
jgi:hypothetical protein